MAFSFTQIATVDAIDILEIKNKLLARESNFFEGYKPFPTDYELAEFANLAYETDIAAQRTYLVTNLPEWQILAAGNNKDDDFFGVAYWHSKHRQLVISHRGTASLTSLLVAGHEGIIHNKITSQMASAQEFVEEVKKLVQDEISISFTGHSLGGWLAYLSTYHAEEQGVHAHTVAFDPPAPGGMLEELEPRIGRQISLAALDVTSYLSEVNLINSCNGGYHIGAVYHISPISEAAGKFARITLSRGIVRSIESHPMAGILAAFKAGRCRPVNAQLVLDWPSVKWGAETVSTNRVRAFFKLLRDYIFKADDSEFDDFLSKCKQLNESDISELTFPERYMLEHRAKYRVTTISPRECLAAVFDTKTLQFLQLYQTLRFIFNENPPGIVDFFAKHSLTYTKNILNYFSIVEEDVHAGKRLILRCPQQSLDDFIRYIHALVYASPNFIEDFNVYVSNIMPQLNERINTLSDMQKADRNSIEGLKKSFDSLKSVLELTRTLNPTQPVASQNIPDSIKISVRLTTPILYDPKAKAPDISKDSFLDRHVGALLQRQAPPLPVAKEVIIGRDIVVGAIAILDIFSTQFEEALDALDSQKKTMMMQQMEEAEQEQERRALL